MKKVVNCYYVHKSNIDELYDKLPSFIISAVKATFQEGVELYGFGFDIVKVDVKRKTVSLIECPTFNILEEPIVGDSYCYNIDTDTWKVILGGSKVYHHKWQFVGPDYKGFDIYASKRRSEILNSIQEFKENKSRIGNFDYWCDFLKRNGLSR